jgi:thiamine biosynthesis lipoprotein
VKLVNAKIIKSNPDIHFDFNAIGKGYGVDVIGRFFEENKCENYRIELGGEIRARGVDVNGDYWRVWLEDPNTDGTRTVNKFVRLENKSLATSGNYRKFRIGKDGRKYVHTINAKTGYATESNLLAATVISELDCADVDGYATAFMAMGIDKVMLFLEQYPELQANLIYVDEKGEIQTFTSEGLLVTYRQ